MNSSARSLLSPMASPAGRECGTLEEIAVRSLSAVEGYKRRLVRPPGLDQPEKEIRKPKQYKPSTRDRVEKVKKADLNPSPRMFQRITDRIEDYARSTVEEDSYLELGGAITAYVSQPESIRRMGVPLDCGASHNVFYRSRIPKGAREKEVDLAHGTKRGYVKDGDITFVAASVNPEREESPAIVSFG